MVGNIFERIMSYFPQKYILSWVWWGRCEQNYLPKEEGREGGEKSARSAPAGPGPRTRDLLRARRGSGAAGQGGCLDKQAFPCL